jgi:hypothetical protein
VNHVTTGQSAGPSEYRRPIEVITDPLLSKQEKAESLEDLEQDARQLATASGEGMSGGEPTALAEVLCERGAGATLYGFRL